MHHILKAHFGIGQSHKLRTMARAVPKAKGKSRKHKVILTDVSVLKADRERVKQELKKLTKEVKIQMQKKRRVLKAANQMEDEDLLWLLQEREKAKALERQQSNATAEQNADESQRPEEGHTEEHAEEAG